MSHFECSCSGWKNRRIEGVQSELSSRTLSLVGTEFAVILCVSIFLSGPLVTCKVIGFVLPRFSVAVSIVPFTSCTSAPTTWSSPPWFPLQFLDSPGVSGASVCATWTRASCQMHLLEPGSDTCQPGSDTKNLEDCSCFAAKKNRTKL